MKAKRWIFYIAVFVFVCLAAVQAIRVIQVPAPTAHAGDVNLRWILPPEYYRGNDFHEGRA